MSGCWEARELVIAARFGKSTRGIRAGSIAHRIPGFTEVLAKFPHQSPLCPFYFWSKGILMKKELETGIGYLEIIGPHPLFLAEIDHWKKGNSCPGILQRCCKQKCSRIR
jgi:hypothetical protein